MVKRWLLPGTMLAALLLVAGFIVAPRTITAQDMSASPAAEAQSHPAHIHMGTCATLGEVMYPLEDVAHVGDLPTESELGGEESTPAAERDEMVEGDAATPTDASGDMGEPAMMATVVAQSTTTVDASLDDILGAEHAINVHESMDNIQNYIACGDIAGTATDGMLEIQLNELNDSGYEGTATLTDNGDGTTTVVVELSMVEDGMGDGLATPTS
jgi:hypothetical protein